VNSAETYRYVTLVQILCRTRLQFVDAVLKLQPMRCWMLATFRVSASAATLLKGPAEVAWVTWGYHDAKSHAFLSSPAHPALMS
jgi:hypothetical protein